MIKRHSAARTAMTASIPLAVTAILVFRSYIILVLLGVTERERGWSCRGDKDQPRGGCFRGGERVGSRIDEIRERRANRPELPPSRCSSCVGRRRHPFRASARGRKRRKLAG